MSAPASRCTVVYTVTQADVSDGALTNTATATGMQPGSNTPLSSDPSTVRVTIRAAPAPADALASTGSNLPGWLGVVALGVLIAGGLLLLIRRLATR